MKLFPVFNPPCLFVFSVAFLYFSFLYFFWYFPTFLFRIVAYLECNGVRYPYHFSLCYYSITYPADVRYFSNFKTLKKKDQERLCLLNYW